MLPAARRSASYASITGHPTARRPRATAPATRAATAAGTCRGPPCPCRSTISRPSSPPRRMRPSSSSKARNAPTSPPISASPSPQPARTVPRLHSFPTGRRWPAAPSPSSRDADADGMGYVTKVAALLAALDPPAQVHIISLPGLSDGEDIEQWADARRSAGLAATRPPHRAAIPDRRGVLTPRRRLPDSCRSSSRLRDADSADH